MRCTDRNTVEASAESRAAACAKVPPRTRARSTSRSGAVRAYCIFAMVDFISAYFLCVNAILQFIPPQLKTFWETHEALLLAWCLFARTPHRGPRGRPGHRTGKGEPRHPSAR